MKNEIINFVMNILCFTWIQNWSYESAKNFCKLILDGEGIDYQEEDFKTYNLSHNNTKTPETVKGYAKMYKDIYINTDQEKALEMIHIIESCNKILTLNNNLNNIFSDEFKYTGPEGNITIKKGDSITLENGALSDLDSNDIEKLINVTFKEEREEEPFTINFSASVPEELKEEVIRLVAPIFKEARAKIERRKVK